MNIKKLTEQKVRSSQQNM